MAAGADHPSAAAARGARRPWSGRRVVLGVAGGIAAYKSVQLARDLTLLGARVDVVLTRSARSFVGPITFEALTGRPVAGDLIETGRALDHIRIAREADVVCVAPATADLMARAAAGRANDMLTAILLATRAPVLLCPAMNDAMWAHPATQANAERLSALGYRLAGPAEGRLAYGEGEGAGRMLEPGVILEHIGRALEPAGPLRDRRVLVTAGPTREPVDPVRVLSNRSSGRMGFAIAASAWRRGADVVVIAGPVTVHLPPGPRVVRVETAEQMAAAVSTELAAADVLVMAAAVADFRPADPAARKIRRASAPDSIALEPAPDILLASRARAPDRRITVGFALETGNGLESARRKLVEKGLDLIVLNEIGEGTGFEVDTNRVVVIDSAGGEEEIALMPKSDLAEILLDRVESLLDAGTA